MVPNIPSSPAARCPAPGLCAESAGEAAATCAYLFVSLLTSSFLLALSEAGRFSGAGLLLRKVALKPAQKDLEESVAGANFDPWMPFWSVHTTRTHRCERLPCPGASFLLPKSLGTGDGRGLQPSDPAGRPLGCHAASPTPGQFKPG